MQFDKFVAYMQLFYQENPDAPKEGQILILNEDTYAKVAIDQSGPKGMRMHASLGEVLNYYESGISGCLVEKLRDPHMFGLHTPSGEVAQIISSLGTVEFRKKSPYKFHMADRSYWII